MAGSSVPVFDAPARRTEGRLGLVGLLVLGVVAMAALTTAQAPSRAETAAANPSTDPASGLSADEGDAGAARPPTFAFGSVTTAGAIVFRLGDAVRASAVDATGATRWQHDMAEGDHLTCGPCPAAILKQASGRAVSVSVDGTVGPPPPELAGQLVDTRSMVGVVLAAARREGRVELLVPTSDGLVSAGSLEQTRLDQPLVVVTPAVGAAAATVLQASPDPLRQGEFEVVHVDPGGSTVATVALDGPDARPLPCAVADDATVAYVQLRPGPTAAGSTHLVVGRDGQPAIDTVVTGGFDACAAGTWGAVLGTAAVGADGDQSHAGVSLVWIDGTGARVAAVDEPVSGPTPSLALDARTARAAVAGGSDPLVVLDGSSRIEQSPAAAVAFDDRSGLWVVDPAGSVRHEAIR